MHIEEHRDEMISCLGFDLKYCSPKRGRNYIYFSHILCECVYIDKYMYIHIHTCVYIRVCLCMRGREICIMIYM